MLLCSILFGSMLFHSSVSFRFGLVIFGSCNILFCVGCNSIYIRLLHSFNHLLHSVCIPLFCSVPFSSFLFYSCISQYCVAHSSIYLLIQFPHSSFRIGIFILLPFHLSILFWIVSFLLFCLSIRFCCHQSTTFFAAFPID